MVKLNGINQTSEGVNFWAFVAEPAATVDHPSICNGKSIKDWLESKYKSSCAFGIDNLTNGVYKLGGWCFDFRPYMKKYIYKSECGIYTAYAPSVKGLRSALSLGRKVPVALAPKGF